MKANDILNLVIVFLLGMLIMGVASIFIDSPVRYLPTDLKEFSIQEIEPVHREYKFFLQSLEEGNNITYTPNIKIYEIDLNREFVIHRITSGMQSSRTEKLYISTWDRQ